MQQNDTVQLLISCESQAQLEACLALFRDGGRSARAHRVTSLRDLGDMLRGQAWDLFIAQEKHPEVTPSEALSLLRECASEVPCVIRAADPSGAGSLTWLREGARDVIGDDDTERLLLAAWREIEAYREHRELAELRVQYEETARRCELLLASSQEAIAYVVDGMHVQVNEIYAGLFGYADVEELSSIPLVDLIAGARQQEFKDALRRYRADPETRTAIDFTGMRADGSEFAGQLVLSTASFEGEPCMQVLVRAAPAAAVTASSAASTDGVAGAGGIQALCSLLSAASGGQLLLISVDGFAQHCRNLGVIAANRLVDQLGGFIARNAGWADAPLRVGNGTLALRLAVSDPEQAASDARRALEAVADQIHEVGQRSVTCSISVVVCPLDGTGDASVEALIDRCWNTMLSNADNAQSLRAADPARIALLVESAAGAAAAGESASLSIDDALREGQFSLLFQPIVSLRGDTSEYYEVNTRHQPSGRPALKWLAEEHPGVATTDLDQWVINESLAKLAEHRASHPDTRLILPLGAGSVMDADFANWLAVNLRTAGLPPDSVVLQIAHLTVSSHLRQAKELVERLKGLGCQVCVSDVHSANNPIPDLLHLRPQFARIDDALAAALKDNESTNTLLKPLIESMHQEQIASIMPNVEGAGVLAVLWQLGLNFIQGNYLQPPLPEMQYDFTDLA